jgi:hypothetical protein
MAFMFRLSRADHLFCVTPYEWPPTWGPQPGVARRIRVRGSTVTVSLPSWDSEIVVGASVSTVSDVEPPLPSSERTLQKPWDSASLRGIDGVDHYFDNRNLPSTDELTWALQMAGEAIPKSGNSDS